MNKAWIGVAFIVCGIVYGSLAIDDVYTYTLGWLVENKWISPPPAGGNNDLKSIFGRKPTILFYAGILIIIGIFVLWNRNN